MKPPFRSDSRQLRKLKLKIRYEIEEECFVFVEGEIDKRELMNEIDEYTSRSLPPARSIKITSNREVRIDDPDLSDQFCAYFDDMDIEFRAKVIVSDRKIDNMISKDEIDLPEVCPHCDWDFDNDPMNYELTWSGEEVSYNCGVCDKVVASYKFKTPVQTHNPR